MNPTLRVDSRYNGPPDSANGGYVCGLMAAAVGTTVKVRLHRPPPLDVTLQIIDNGSAGNHAWQLFDGDALLATATPAEVHAHVPTAPDYLTALDASVHYIGHRQHPFATCFVCGPKRATGDGLRIFPGKLTHSNLVAAPWLPHAALDDGQGKVRAEFIWAALDCPGYFSSIRDSEVALLGELSVHIDRKVHIDEPCVIIGWPILIEGRKHKVGTALFDEKGERCAVGQATWLEI